MTKDTFYLTTPLYYTNSTPHIGHAYSTIAADILSRFHRVSGSGRAHFLTGTDEHGLKIADAAVAAGKTPKQFTDEIVQRWKSEWASLDIEYDQFIRTTDPEHEAAVQRIFFQLREQGDIVPGTYEGWYCRHDETFWPEAKLVDGRCPNPECGREVEWVSEDAWFFKLTQYRDRLIEHYNAHPGWVRPASAFNEMASLLRGGLEDLCVSRAGVTWGIPIPGESKTIYVWFDAICNYITAAGYPHDMERFAHLWPADVQLIGKEILRFHTVLWPAILMALKLPLPKLVFANGWITMEGQKMSKSVGNVVRPAELLQHFPVDAVRYVLFAQAPFGTDFGFSEDGLVRRYNAELANDLGNLVQRVLSMLARYRDGIVPARTSGDELNVEFEATADAVQGALAEVDFRAGLSAIWERVNAMNLYVEQTKPWVLHKEGDQALLDETMYNLCEGLRWISALIYPFMPDSARTTWESLGQTGIPGQLWEETLRWGSLAPGIRTRVPAALFPRVESVAH